MGESAAQRALGRACGWPRRNSNAPAGRSPAANSAVLRISFTSLTWPPKLTPTFMVTRLVAVNATAPGLPSWIPASPAPFRCLPVQRAPISETATPAPEAAVVAGYDADLVSDSPIEQLLA